MARVSEALRILVFTRADNRCEYCLIHSNYSYFSFHIEHIISLKHGGETITDNLALACPICNLNKGTDIATMIQSGKDLIRFYNPRADKWADHFLLGRDGFIQAKTSIGEATIKILKLNHPDSIIERKEMLGRKLLST